MKQADFPEVYALTRIGFMIRVRRMRKHGWKTDDASAIHQLLHHSVICYRPPQDV